MEKKIIQIFNEKGPVWMEGNIQQDNFELQAVLGELEVSQSQNTNILDIGSGTGRFANELQKMGFFVVGLEPAKSLRSIAQTKYPQIDFLAGSVTQLPVADGSFNVVICIEVLEHVPDTKLAIREMYRVLKPGGKLIIIDKNINSLHYLFFIPTKFWKWWKEITNQWMYEKNFGFTEKYFSVSSLESILKSYFLVVTTTPLLFSLIEKKRSFFFSIIAILHKQISAWVHRFMPLNSFFYMWVATK